MTRPLLLLLCCLLLSVSTVEAELLVSKKKGLFGSLAKGMAAVGGGLLAAVVGGILGGLLKPKLADLPPNTEVCACQRRRPCTPCLTIQCFGSPVHNL